MKWLVFILALLPEAVPAAGCKIEFGRSCSTAVSFSGYAVPSLGMRITDGVLVVNIDGVERFGFYDDRLLAVEVTEQGINTIGSRIVWAGTPEMVASR